MLQTMKLVKRTRGQADKDGEDGEDGCECECGGGGGGRLEDYYSVSDDCLRVVRQWQAPGSCGIAIAIAFASAGSGADGPCAS